MVQAMTEGYRYPFLVEREFIQMIADHEGVTPEHIVVGTGSGEILCMAGLTYGQEGGELLAADPTYQGLTRYAEHVGAYIHRGALDDEMKHDLDAMDRRITQAVKLVFVCNPNNPTGTLVDSTQLRDFCKSNSSRTLIFMDEAYIELCDDPEGTSMVGLVKDGYNVIVSRTFSKVHGLAGLRIGYGIMRPDIARRIAAYRMGSSNVMALRAAMASYQDAEFMAFSKARIEEGHRFVYDLCDEMGYSYVPSQGNFVFYNTGRPILKYQSAMRDKGVWVGRPFPPYDEWCRLSIGTMEDLKAFASAMRQV